MAGLLDIGAAQPAGGLLGDLFNDPGARLGMSLLAASSPKLRGLGVAMAQQDQAKQQAMQQQLMQSQINENAIQNKQREMQMQNAMAQQARENAFFGIGGTAPTTQGPGMITTQPSAGGSFAQQNAVAGSSGPAPSSDKFDEWSRIYNIPKDALMVDYIKNGGKGIAEMIAKRGTPDMQVTNGYAYDKNRLNAGYLPQLNISNDGKATQVRIGPDGQPVISAPRGAPETFGTYQGIQAGIQSANTPIKVFNPQTQREEIIPQATALRGASAQPQYSGAGYNGGSAAAAAPEQLQIIQSELGKLPPNHPDRPALMREMQRLGGGQEMQQPGNYAAGPSAAEAAANEARKVQAVEQVKADISPTATKIGAVDTARDALGIINQALTHPGLKTATGIQGTVDPRNYIAGTDATNFRVLMDQIKGSVFLDAYKDLRGGGAITDIEGAKAEAAKARINRAQSPDEFVKGLNEYKAIVERGLARAQERAGNQGGASGNWGDQAKPGKTVVKTGMYGGKRVVQYSDGSVDYAN